MLGKFEFPPRSIVKIDQAPFQIQANDSMLFLGSCFSENIGGWLRDSGLKAFVNPFGVLYNPHSIGQSLQRLLAGESYQLDQLAKNKDLYFHYDFSGFCNHTDPEQVVNAINQQIQIGRASLINAKLLVLTLGTAWAFTHLQSAQIVANCHKMPPDSFQKHLLSGEQCVTVLADAILAALEVNPNLKILLSVSPIRHWQDGAVANQLSKSVLIQCVHHLIAKYPQDIFYFPAYEILIDELRDYRFYSDDLMHPAPLAIEYIRNQFAQAWLAPQAQLQIKDVQKWLRMTKHRILLPNSADAIDFKKKVAQLQLQLEKQYKLDLSQYVS